MLQDKTDHRVISVNHRVEVRALSGNLVQAFAQCLKFRARAPRNRQLSSRGVQGGCFRAQFSALDLPQTVLSSTHSNLDVKTSHSGK